MFVQCFPEGRLVTPGDARVIVNGHSNIWFTYTMTEDAGNYTCVVRHSAGEITRHYYLDVLGEHDRRAQYFNRKSVTVILIVVSVYALVIWSKVVQRHFVKMSVMSSLLLANTVPSESLIRQICFLRLLSMSGLSRCPKLESILVKFYHVRPACLVFFGICDVS